MAVVSTSAEARPSPTLTTVAVTLTTLSVSAGAVFHRLVPDVVIASLDETALVGEDHDLSAVAQPELGEDARYV